MHECKHCGQINLSTWDPCPKCGTKAKTYRPGEYESPESTPPSTGGTCGTCSNLCRSQLSCWLTSKRVALDWTCNQYKLRVPV